MKYTRKKKLVQLTPVFFCDEPSCLNIMSMEEAMKCSSCKSFYYCSIECQKADWKVKHKSMCGKVVTPESIAMKEKYIEATTAADKIWSACKNGSFQTVIHEKGDEIPAGMFATLAKKSNVLNWQKYLDAKIFTTVNPDAFGALKGKILAAIAKYPTRKIYVITVIFDRLKEGDTAEGIVRLYTSSEFKNSMGVPKNGKVVVTKGGGGPRFRRVRG